MLNCFCRVSTDIKRRLNLEFEVEGCIGIGSHRSGQFYICCRQEYAVKKYTIVQVSGIVIRMMESTNEVEKNIIEAICLTKPKQGMCND